MTSEKTTIQSIRQLLLEIDSIDDIRLTALKEDPRKGVQAIVNKWQRDFDKKQDQLADLELRLEFERRAHLTGHRYVAGIDEVGRGPLAGPVVAAAVILPDDFNDFRVNDSKKTSKAVRNELFDIIEAQAVAIGVGSVSQKMIDKINIYEATKLAMTAAVNELSVAPDYLLIDAMKLPTLLPQESLIKGDARSLSIAAASIIAKVTRDRLMEEFSKQYPGYGFEKNAGYGTKEHLSGIKSYGICPLHRKSFSPIKEIVQKSFK